MRKESFSSAQAIIMADSDLSADQKLTMSLEEIIAFRQQASQQEAAKEGQLQRLYSQRQQLQRLRRTARGHIYGRYTAAVMERPSGDQGNVSRTSTLTKPNDVFELIPNFIVLNPNLGAKPALKKNRYFWADQLCLSQADFFFEGASRNPMIRPYG
jgi:hypothetical protein